MFFFALHCGHEVLESFPLTAKVSEVIRIFTLPDGPLGNSETNYENVTITAVSTADGNPTDVGSVKFASTGKLGSLQGGLLNMADSRRRASQEDFGAVQAQQIEEVLQKKRQGVGLCWNLLFSNVQN